MKLILCITLLAVAAQAKGQPPGRHFSHTVATTAPPETIWRIWTDVAHWQEWASGLRSAQLLGPFGPGTKGVLRPDKGTKAKFTLVEVVPNESYTFRTKLPLGALYVRRLLTTEAGKTQFTHQVWFSGLSKGLFEKTLGNRYRTLLPGVMDKIRQLAEK